MRSVTGDKGTFALLDQLSDYDKIGSTLNLGPGEDKRVKECATENQKMDRVFQFWVNNAAGLPNSKFFPHTWKGLYDLLKASHYEQVAKRYFIFLNENGL